MTTTPETKAEGRKEAQASDTQARELIHWAEFAPGTKLYTRPAHPAVAVGVDVTRGGVYVVVRDGDTVIYAERHHIPVATDVAVGVSEEDVRAAIDAYQGDAHSPLFGDSPRRMRAALESFANRRAAQGERHE